MNEFINFWYYAQAAKIGIEQSQYITNEQKDYYKQLIDIVVEIARAEYCEKL